MSVFCYSVAALYFVSHICYNCFIEFPDYSQPSKCYIFYSLPRLIAYVTQLNLITFVGLAQSIAETNELPIQRGKVFEIQLNQNITKMN